MSTAGKPGRFAPYKQALDTISLRTRTPLPSLLVSFAILHELTALVPLIGVFYGARALGVGERLVDSIVRDDADSDASYQGGGIFETGWVRQKFKEWVDEGENWAGRVGRRYGMFGFEKGQNPKRGGEGALEHPASHRIADDVANAVVAYAAGKALLPARIGLSLYLSPVFSRRVIEPIRMNVLRPFRRRGPDT